MKKIISLALSACLLVNMLFTAGFSAFALETSFGVDISEHNGDTDYGAIISQDNSFVMIRLGYYNHLDKHFYDNVKKAYENGMDFGVYLYSYAFNEQEANIEADFVIDTLNNLDDKYKSCLKLPVAYDLEDAKILNDGKCRKAQITKHMTIFCDKIKAQGYTPMVYANLNWFTNYIDLNTVVDKEYKIWYAYYNSTDKKPSATSVKEIGSTGVKPDIWQYYAPDRSAKDTFDQNILYCTLASQVKLDSQKYYYDSKVHCPAVTVTDKNGAVLEPEEDYDIAYSNADSSAIGNYTIKIKLKNDYFGRDTFTYSILPNKASLNSLTSTAYGFNACWSKVGEATGYQLQYSTKSDFSNAATVYAGATDTLSKTITGRASGAKYYVRVRSYKNTGNGNYVYSDWSGAKSVTVPAKPPTVKASVSSLSNGFKVSWNKVSNTTGYQVQYSTRSDFKNAATVYGGPATATSKAITGKSAGTLYYVRVRSYKNLTDGTRVWGDWSGSKTVSVPIPKINLKSVSSVAKGFKAGWAKISNVTGYQVQYSTRKDFKNAATVYGGNQNATAKTITGRARNTTYYVRVRAYKNNGGKYVYGAWSNARSVRTK